MVPMADKEKRALEEPLMLKDDIEEEDSEYLYSDEIVRSKPRQNLIFWFMISLPWVLFILLAAWNLEQYRKRDASANFNDPQQIYSLFGLIYRLDLSFD